MVVNVPTVAFTGDSRFPGMQISSSFLWPNGSKQQVQVPPTCSVSPAACVHSGYISQGRSICMTLGQPRPALQTKPLKGLVTDHDPLFIFVAFSMNSEPPL